ncbi:MAG: 3'-5' exonuclease [Burkholderiales bacterium]|nr:3'-5' exonuclease [Burkholderiales bacterium]
MRAPGARLIGVWAGCFALSAGTALALALALAAALAGEERRLARVLLESSGSLPYLLLIMVFAASGLLASWLVKAYFNPIARAAEATAVSALANPKHRLAAEGPAQLRHLIAAINALADHHAAALDAVDARVAEARAALESEKNRLAVLMSELAQSVLVCDPNGTIVLYNEQARRLFSPPDIEKTATDHDFSPDKPQRTGRGCAPDPHGHLQDPTNTWSVPVYSGFIGLGRSLYSLLAPEPVRYAIERLDQRTAAGELDPIGIFTTALPGARLVRVRISPMAGAARSAAEMPAPSGYVLLLEDVSQEVTGVERRDRILIDLIEGARAALASLRAATENLAHFPDMALERRQRFVAIAVEEAGRLSEAVEHASRDHADSARLRPRALESMRGADLVAALRAGLASEVGSVHADEGSDPHIWLDVDCHALVQAVRYLARRLRDEFGIRDYTLEVSGDAPHAYLDLCWLGARISAATTSAWEDDTLSAGGEASSMTLRDILQHHGAELWHEIDRPSGRARFRFMLPVGARAPLRNPSERPGRPVFYDFDLSSAANSGDALDESPLRELAYTVFDTETTGLDPGAGDEIIAIGAVRIVNARVLTGEAFDRLIDPRRRIDPRSVAIHGIGDAMVRGQPTIERVLPAFHRFCTDTVLVGHNVAFDMRFLQLKEDATGVRFRQPVLDTLLLSAVLHDNLSDDRLEAIAHRFGIEVVARHTALGDALVTAEIFLKMLPLLAERGITTLRAARAAAERTRYAQLRY